MIAEITIRKYILTHKGFELIGVRKFKLFVSSASDGVKLAESLHDMIVRTYESCGYDIVTEGETTLKNNKWEKYTILERGINKIRVYTVLVLREV